MQGGRVQRLHCRHLRGQQHDRALARDEHLGAGLERGHAGLGRAPHGVGRSLAGRQGQAGGRGGEESEHVRVGVMRNPEGGKERTPSQQVAGFNLYRIRV